MTHLGKLPFQAYLKTRCPYIFPLSYCPRHLPYSAHLESHYMSTVIITPLKYSSFHYALS